MNRTRTWPWFARHWKRIVVAFLLSLLGCELLLRWTLGLGSPLLFQRDREIGYLVQADQDLRRFGNIIRINAYHQRNGPIEERPPLGTLRILVVGDSISHGGSAFTQADTIPSLIEDDLRGRWHANVEVLNASAGSWGIGNELAYLQRFGTFGSQVVLLQLSTHDLVQEKSSGDVVDRSRSTPSHPPCCALQELIVRYLWPRITGERDERDPPAGTPESRFEQNMQWLRTFFATARMSDARVFVLFVPERGELERRPDGTYPQRLAAFQSRFATLLHEENVPFLDVTPRLSRHSASEALFLDSVHPNLAGNRAIAAWVSERLATELAR